MEAVRVSETSVDNYISRQHIPQDNSEHQILADVIGQIKFYIQVLAYFNKKIKTAFGVYNVSQ
jgi:hypothetical protein